MMGGPARAVRPIRGRWESLLAAAALLPVAAACSGGGDGGGGMTEPDNSDPVASFTANPTSVPAGDNNQTVVTLDASASSDPDGDPLTFNWTVPSGTFVNGTNASSEVAQVTFPGAAPYTVTLEVSDGRGGTDTAAFTVGLGQATNRAPTASITADPTEVPRGDNNTTVVTLDGSGSSDPDGDALSFSWNVPSGTFVNGTSATSEIAQVTFPGSAPYTVTLTVDDGRGGTDQAQVTIQLGAPANNPPTAVATASPDSVDAGDNNTTVVTLDGSGSSDPDGDNLTFSWTVPSGTFVNGTSASSESPQVTFPGNGDYVVTLEVDDGRGGTDQAQVTVFLRESSNSAPTASFTADPPTVPAGDNNTTVVTLDASASSDPDGDSLSFNWTVPGGTFVNGTGPTSMIAQVTFPGSAPYTVTLVVNDGNGGTDSAQFTIQLGS